VAAGSESSATSPRNSQEWAGHCTLAALQHPTRVLSGGQTRATHPASNCRFRPRENTRPSKRPSILKGFVGSGPRAFFRCPECDEIFACEPWPPSLVITPVPDNAAERRPLMPVPPHVTATSMTPRGVVCTPFDPAVFHRAVDTLGPCAPGASQRELPMHGIGTRAADFATTGEPVIQQLGEGSGTSNAPNVAGTQGHWTPKPFACHGFSQKGNYNRHMRVHMQSGEQQSAGTSG
ncbi:hypothetical protein MRX96_044376, partial [Rhipicephalus microplus]